MALWLWLLAALLVVGVWLFRRYLSASVAAQKWPWRVARNGQYKGKKTEEGVFDVLIVGAGPSGATAACYLSLPSFQQRYFPSASSSSSSSSSTGTKLKVGLVDRKEFPRAKYCGDAWCEPALRILDELEILPQMQADGITHPVQRGGFISPSGYSCVGGPYGSSASDHAGIRTFAIKRKIADHYIAKKAVALGAQLFENTEVVEVRFSKEEGQWTAVCADGRTFATRVLIIADGSNSYLARKLGLVDDQPTAVCSHQYIKSSCHQFEADGTMIYTQSLLPGYSALFRHFDGECYLGTYILPGGQATSRWIPDYERNLLVDHPYVRDCFQSHDYSDLQFSVKRKTAPIRIGGIPKSFGDHLLIIGDAAGLVDPATGEGIHTAMISGKMAAQTVFEMFEEGDFSERSTAVYHHRWFKEFGFDFRFSTAAARGMGYVPLFLDAMAIVGKRKGQPFLDLFGAIMTGVKPKYYFLTPSLIFPLALEIIRQFWNQKIMHYPPPMRIKHISNTSSN